jgi:hypothetical protein
MVELVRHRQTKEAATDMFGLQLPRHTSTLPQAAFFLPRTRSRLTAAPVTGVIFAIRSRRSGSHIFRLTLRSLFFRHARLRCCSASCAITVSALAIIKSTASPDRGLCSSRAAASIFVADQCCSMIARAEEIHQLAVTHQFRDMAVEARHRRRDGALERADQFAHVFGIEPRRQRRRADRIAEHHRQLTALSQIGRHARGDRARSRRRLLRCAQSRNRLEESFAVAQRHAKLTEVALRQPGQNFGVDFALTEGGLILTETEARGDDHSDDKACPGQWSGMAALGPGCVRRFHTARYRKAALFLFATCLVSMGRAE